MGVLITDRQAHYILDEPGLRPSSVNFQLSLHPGIHSDEVSPSFLILSTLESARSFSRCRRIPRVAAGMSESGIVPA
jgi:hypothetical protein